MGRLRGLGAQVNGVRNQQPAVLCCAVLCCAVGPHQVRYTCARDVKENAVLSVKEFPSCNYVVVISTPFLCKHPAFVPVVSNLW